MELSAYVSLAAGRCYFERSSLSKKIRDRVSWITVSGFVEDKQSVTVRLAPGDQGNGDDFNEAPSSRKGEPCRASDPLKKIGRPFILKPKGAAL